MPSPDVQLTRPLDREARKRLLLIACTIDRLEVATARRGPEKVASILSGLVNEPWLQRVVPMLIPLLPGRLGMIAKAWRMWQGVLR
jgi:hypothetical protein